MSFLLIRLCGGAETGLVLTRVRAPVTLACASVHHHRERHNLERYIGMRRSNPQKANRNTHMNEAMFRDERGRKNLIIKLPDFDLRRKQDKWAPDEMRKWMMREGINPYEDVSPRMWQERKLFQTTLEQPMNPYIPPEESLKGIQIPARFSRGIDRFKDSTSKLVAERRIRKKIGLEKFSAKEFAAIEADDIYDKAHIALMQRDKKALLNYATATAFVKMWRDVERGSIVWEKVKTLSPSKMVSVSCQDFPAKSGNDFAQITVRLHNLQKLAIYDQFGRLLLGSEEVAREVIEYVIFENHVASVDGRWRILDKIYPKWSKPKEGVIRTFQVKADDEEDRTTEPVDLELSQTSDTATSDSLEKPKDFRT